MAQPLWKIVRQSLINCNPKEVKDVRTKTWIQCLQWIYSQSPKTWKPPRCPPASEWINTLWDGGPLLSNQKEHTAETHKSRGGPELGYAESKSDTEDCTLWGSTDVTFGKGKHCGSVFHGGGDHTKITFVQTHGTGCQKVWLLPHTTCFKNEYICWKGI